ncbi:MAG: nucleoside-diphosphate kinase [Thermoguttaceae bacterium]|nr:nucleoside-diphosphate kinase [Thermoguttaceae bacterium]MDW8037464.1 nucleoside-diphosphate kinase [Thermoguttaceae bacterium]
MQAQNQDAQEFQLTLVLIKPDALKLSLTGYILSQLSETHTGLRFAAAKIVHVSRRLAEQHYAEHRGKPFYTHLINYIMGKSHYPDLPHRRRVIAIVYSGYDAVNTVRRIAGPTNPHEAREKAPGSIRALGTVVPIKDAEGRLISERLDNLIHASATPEEAEREIKLWFTPTDIMPFMRIYPTDYAQEHYYLSEEGLTTSWRPGCYCVVAAGELVWKSDLEALRLWRQGKPTPISLDAVIAKYLINTEQTPAE